VEDWAEIRRLRRAEGLPIKAIVRVLGVSRNTVRKALASDAPPKYQRKPSGSIVDEVEPRIRELLMAYPMMPAVRHPRRRLFPDKRSRSRAVVSTDVGNTRARSRCSGTGRCC
jgi:transposase